MLTLGTTIALMLVCTATPISTPATPVNQRCPVLADEPVDPAITAVYDGQTVGFCCDRCRRQFLADPGRYAATLAAMVAEASTMPAPTNARTLDVERGGDQAGASSNGEPDSRPRSPLLGRLHPVIVHFPVAGIPLALLGLLMWLASGRQAFTHADVPPLLIAAAAAGLAVITGDIAKDAARFVGGFHDVVEWHELAGITTMIVTLVLLTFRLWRWNRLIGAWLWVYGIGLTVATILVSITGYLGGSLVFGLDHLSW